MKYILFLTLTLILSCTDKIPIKASQNVSMYDSPLIDRDIALKNPYDLTLDIEKGKGDRYIMTTAMNLHGGSFYVSPLSPDGFKGRFTISIEDNDFIKLKDSYVETPESKRVFDPHQFVNGPINWVQVDTRYDHKLVKNSEKDFKVQGKIIFTIEPRCSLEDIPFVIESKSGVLKIEKCIPSTTCGEV